MLVVADHLSKTFHEGDTKIEALRSVSLTIEEGGIVALMGPSGSGKSSLLNLVGALDKPTSGSITVAGQNIAEMSKDQQATFRNEKVGFIFQSFNLIPVLSTIENVILPSQLSSHPVNEKEIDQRARELLDRVGLKDQINQGVNKLSGGQMQRVAIARSLINKPKLILADEPTANLDQGTSDKVLTLLKDLCQSQGVTVLMATHDHGVLSFCDRVIKLQDGNIIQE